MSCYQAREQRALFCTSRFPVLVGVDIYDYSPWQTHIVFFVFFCHARSQNISSSSSNGKLLSQLLSHSIFTVGISAFQMQSFTAAFSWPVTNQFGPSPPVSSIATIYLVNWPAWWLVLLDLQLSLSSVRSEAPVWPNVAVEEGKSSHTATQTLRKSSQSVKMHPRCLTSQECSFESLNSFCFFSFLTNTRLTLCSHSLSRTTKDNKRQLLA